MRLCRYAGQAVGAPLRRDVLLSARQARELVADYDALRQPGPRLISCFFTVVPIVARLSYRSGHTVTIYSALGCFSPFNGDIDRVFPNHAAERLGNALLRLT